MYLFVIKLVNIFKLKKKIFDDLKSLVGGIKEIIDVPYTDESQELVLKHKPFHKDTGLLPLLENLFNANNELVHYQDDEDSISIKDQFGINMSQNLVQCGLTIHRNYLDMMAVVEREQYFIDKFFKPTLEEIRKKKKYKEEWAIRLSHFRNFIKVLEVDLEYFYILLHNLKDRGFLGESIEVRNKNRAIIKNNVVVSIEANDLIHARYWINYGKNKDWFNKEEIKIFTDLVFFIEQQDGYQLKQIIESETFKKIFNQEEIEFFNSISIQLVKKYILTLIPINILPRTPIDIISIYHSDPEDALEIGIGEDCDIKLIDSLIDDTIQAKIMFLSSTNDFVIIKRSEETVIKINDKAIENSSKLEGGYVLDINGYEFKIRIGVINEPIPPIKQYNKIFLDMVPLRLVDMRVDMRVVAQIIQDLEEENVDLDNLRKIAQEFEEPEIIEKIDEEAEKINGAIAELEEVTPQAGKIPQVKKFKKSKFRRLRERFRLAGRRYKKINKREILNRGLKVLNHSIALRNRLNTYLESLRIKFIIHKKEQIENEIMKWLDIQKKAIYFLRIGNNFRSSTKAALNKVIEEANSMINKLKKVKDISVSKKVIKLSYLRRFAIYSLMSTYMALGLGGTVGTFSTKEVLDVKPIQGEEETIRIPLINTEVNLNPITAKEISDAEPKKVIEEPMQKPVDAISSITNRLQQEESLPTEPEIPSVTVRSSISETAPNLQRQDRQFSTTKPPTIRPIIKESQIKETEFRLKILEGARVQVGLPVDFDTLFLNVCIDIVVRSMQSGGIKIEGNVNKRLVASVAPWMMRNKAKPKALNEVKPGMMIFFSGMDSDTNKFKEWKHSGVVYEVNADGTIKSVVMSTSYPWDGSAPQVKLVNFDDWLKRTFKNYGMKVRAILDPYDLVRSG